jgi:predicted Zn finger-like uncharacterized protein
MRLICPNCDAEYEVDDAAVPDAGRDVQCSNCGHAWFQAGPGHDAAPDAAPVFPDVPASEQTADELADEPADIADALALDAPVPDAPLRARTVDDAVMAVLQEEAAREVAARRAEEAPAVETQPDLGLDAGHAATRAHQIAVMKGDEVADVAPPPPPPAARQTTRREMLPDIEEINSTLRPSSAATSDAQSTYDMPEPVTRTGFRSGFVLMLVVAAVLVALYLMAPRLAQQIPGAKGALEAYVAGVDAARVWLDSATKSVVGALQRLAGKAG